MHNTETSCRFNCVYDKKGYIGVLTVSGALTPGCARELNMRLMDSMSDSDFVVVNLDQVTRFDSDCCSLFCMAARIAFKENKRLRLGRATSEQKIAASQMCSLNYTNAAQDDCAKYCFWMEQAFQEGTVAP